jgi:hypothetical protein
MNVQSIQIMLKLNIDAKSKDVAFTKSLLYHPDYAGLSITEGFNDYPYISNNTMIPYDELRLLNYLEKASFFFDKNIFQTKCAEIKQEDEKDKWDTLRYNTTSMLKLLFPTVVPINENVNSSFESNINKGSIFSNMKFNTDSILELINYYKFSFVRYGGKEYTVSRVVWLDDVINNPEYSKLFDDFNAFQTWSLATLNKLLEVKKRLYVKIVDTCKDELTDNDRNVAVRSNSTIPAINNFDAKKAFNNGHRSILALKSLPGSIDAVSARTRAGEKDVNFRGLISSNITPEILKTLDEDVISIARLAWRVDYMDRQKIKTIEDAKFTTTTNVDVTRNDDDRITKTANELHINYEKCKVSSQPIKDVDDLKKAHMVIQGYIEALRVKQMNDAIEAIVSEKGSTFSRQLQTLVRKLMTLEKENDDEIVAIIERIVDNKGKQTLPSKYSYLNEISEKMNKFSTEYRTLSPIDRTDENSTQQVLDDYVYRKSKATDVKAFINKVADFKKKPKYENTDFLYAGIVELYNDDAKLPGYLINVQLDVLGGKLDPSIVSFAKCRFSDKKLTRMFNNIRQNVKDNGVIVKPGPFFNLDDMKVKVNPKVTVKNKPVKGGRRTNKRRS